MIGIVVSEKIKTKIEPLVNETVTVLKEGSFGEEEILQILKNLANTELDLLILDLDCAPQQAWIKGLRLFRFARSQTRIIALAPARKPGDPTLSALVSLGVYDLLAPEDDENILPALAKAIKQPANYADAARWHFSLNVETETEEKPKKKEKRRHEPLAEDLDFEAHLTPSAEPALPRLIGTATIAVAGVTRRCGSTLLAASVATFLSRRTGAATACVEMNQFPVFETFQENEGTVLGKGFKKEKVDYFPKTNPALLKSIYSQDYRFLVFDFGQVTDEEQLNELGRAQIVLLAMGSSEWDFCALLRMLDGLHGLRFAQTWNVFVNFSDHKTFEHLERAFTRNEREKLRIRFYHNPISPVVANVHPDQEKHFEELFKEFLIQKKKKIKIF